MATYEGVFIEYDRKGNATPHTMDAVSTQLQQKSILNPEEFGQGVLTAWDPARDLAAMEEAKVSSERRRRAVRACGGATHPKAVPVPSEPTTVAEIMGWGKDHLPAEMTASPIRPAAPRQGRPSGEAPVDAPAAASLPQNDDVTVEVSEDGAYDMRDMHEAMLAELTARLDEKIAALDVCAPRAMTLEMLVTMARNEWRERRLEKDPDADRHALGLPQGEFARKNIVVNFVKHELVFPRYDDVVAMINEYSLKVYDQDLERCYARWRRAVIDRLSEAFPVLAETANAQKLRRYDQRTGQLVAIGH